MCIIMINNNSEENAIKEAAINKIYEKTMKYMHRPIPKPRKTKKRKPKKRVYRVPLVPMESE